MSNIIYWIWFASLRNLRGSMRKLLLERFGEPKAVFTADRSALSACGASSEELEQLMLRDTGPAEHIISRCDEEEVQILTIQDAAYPERLRNIPDPPCVLYIKGRLPAVDCEAVIAVVGTRKSTPYGDKMARNMGYGIAKGGGIVATGLAEGIDSSAAQGALMAGGRVVGVLGTAINQVYPGFNRPLFDDVAATGALVSEYPPDAGGNKAYFPARNRIMAGLSLGTVVVEAPKRSGALITAHRAADYGRDVFAIPGNADAVNSRGSNGLLSEGARLVENGWDVLKEYENLFPNKLSRDGRQAVPEERAVPESKAPEKNGAEKTKNAGESFFKLRVPVRKKKAAEPEQAATELECQLSGLNEAQLKIVGAMKKPSMHVDDIIDLSQLPASTVLAELTLLQIKGFVTQEGGKRFTLNITKRG